MYEPLNHGNEDAWVSVFFRPECERGYSLHSINKSSLDDREQVNNRGNYLENATRCICIPMDEQWIRKWVRFYFLYFLSSFVFYTWQLISSVSLLARSVSIDYRCNGKSAPPSIRNKIVSTPYSSHPTRKPSILFHSHRKSSILPVHILFQNEMIETILLWRNGSSLR